MAENRVYETSIAWDDVRPDTLVICCSDGRWRPAIQEFATRYLAADLHADQLAVPGGIEPLTLLNFVPKDFNFLKRRLEGRVEGHGTRRIVAIAHQDCLWYRQHAFGPLKLDLRQRQSADLRRAAALLREMFPHVTVETYYAWRSDASPPRIVFEDV